MDGVRLTIIPRPEILTITYLIRGADLDLSKNYGLMIKAPKRPKNVALDLLNRIG